MRNVWKADADLTTPAHNLRTQLKTSPLRQYRHFVLRKIQDAVEAYRAAVGTRPEPSQVLSMMVQAMDIAEDMYGEAMQDRLLRVFQGEEGES